MQSLAIIFLCLVSAVGYGILHDQITARVCVEYFTIGHPPIFGTDDPTLLGIGWGILATWWVGLLLGIPLAVAARAGPRSKRDALSLLRPIASLLTIMALCAFVAGLAAWLSGEGGLFFFNPVILLVPQEKRAAFAADAWAHTASYLVGFFGGIVVIVRVWRSRARVDGNA